MSLTHTKHINILSYLNLSRPSWLNDGDSFEFVKKVLNTEDFFTIEDICGDDQSKVVPLIKSFIKVGVVLKVKKNNLMFLNDEAGYVLTNSPLVKEYKHLLECCECLSDVPNRSRLFKFLTVVSMHHGSGINGWVARTMIEESYRPHVSRVPLSTFERLESVRKFLMMTRTMGDYDATIGPHNYRVFKPTKETFKVLRSLSKISEAHLTH